MGIILYCDNTKYYMSYKIWNKIKNYLGIISIKYLEKLINQNNYLKAKVNFKTAQYEYVFRIKLLEFYKGEALTL